AWSFEGAAESFTVEVRDEEGKLTRRASETASLAYSAPAPGTFSWRVRVGGAGEWTKWSTFQVLPGAPALAVPEPSAKVTAREPEVGVGFQWEGGLATGYRLEVSAGDRFDDASHKQRVTGSSATLRLTPGLYLWRVIAESDVGVETASEVRALAVVPHAPLPSPVLAAPPPGAVIPEGAVAFAWNAVADASRYELAVRRPGASEPEVLPASEPRVSFAVADEGEYEWRVRAIEADGTPGQWSSQTLFNRGRPRIARAVFRPGSRWSVAAGSEVTSFEVDVYDARGRPVEGAPLAAASDLGSVVSLGADGATHRFAFLAPEHVHEATVAEIRVADRDFATTAQVNIRPPPRFRFTARAGFATNLGALAGPWVGAEVAMKAPMVRRAWILGRVGSFGGGMEIPASLGLDAPLRADARVISASVLAAYEWSAPSGTLQVGAGPALHFAHVETNRQSGAMWDAGLELTVGIARRWGPGKALVQASLDFGTAEGTLARMRTGGLVVSVGYGWEP
ncbi:MAG TPA: hypothetical protein VE549_10420, partial [Myxococcaceae bacterium]|nr:hypothetical protein [Myxococcaceae bacterium]